jgi:hypothetical protein
MESVYHIVTIHVNETSWTHVWRLRSRYLGTGYDKFYGLELHHLTLSRILPMAAFVTLCDAYMGIECHFNLWNYFFHAWLQQGLGVEPTALNSVYIFVRFGRRVDPYFHLPIFSPLNRWQKARFFLRNNTDASLPVLTGSRPIPHPS